MKIGRFTNAVDLQYQDTIEDSLIKIADKVIDLIYLKYLKAKITYEHDRRVENEAIIISNQCFFPEGWTVETLMKPHQSKPYNPNIANVFYRAGYIENWGRGGWKISNNYKTGRTYIRSAKTEETHCKKGGPEKWLLANSEGCLVRFKKKSRHGLFRSGTWQVLLLVTY